MTEGKNSGTLAVARAAIIAFGFVFIHPFLDGNGRIHRFLIHDMLTRDGLSEQGLIIPVSAHMLQNIVEYDTVLELLELIFSENICLFSQSKSLI